MVIVDKDVLNFEFWSRRKYLMSEPDIHS